MLDYKLSLSAKKDLKRIYIYGTNQFGVAQADSYFATLYKYFEIIAQRPFAFESVDHIRKGYRRCPCGSDSIYYRINENVVEIMAIIGRQDLSSKL